MAGVLSVEVGCRFVLVAVRARFGVYRGRGDQHLFLVAHRVHLRTAGPAAVHDVKWSVHRLVHLSRTAGEAAGQRHQCGRHAAEAPDCCRSRVEGGEQGAGPPAVAVHAVGLPAVQVVAGRGLVQLAARAGLVRPALRGDLQGAAAAGPQQRGRPRPLPAAAAPRRWCVVLIRLRGVRPAACLSGVGKASY